MEAASHLFQSTIDRQGGHRGTTMEPKEIAERYAEAVKSHPFVHRGHYHTVLRDSAHVKDAKGNTVCILLRNALPTKAADLASDILTPAATRTSLRAGIFGGESPLSGIAGYYDYWGSPIEYKCRKTSFTCETLNAWPDVFPLLDYVGKLYEKVCPDAYKRQKKAVPQAVKIHDSPFSTLTINQRFRTAMHTDAGDFDKGFGCITCVDARFEGCFLGFPHFGVCCDMRKGDLIFFETHHWHANTELEMFPSAEGLLNWSRVTVVMYYRTSLGEQSCLKEYERRLSELKKERAAAAKKINSKENTKQQQQCEKDDSSEEGEAENPATSPEFEKLIKEGLGTNVNGVNFNRPAEIFAQGVATPFQVLLQLFATSTTVTASIQNNSSNASSSSSSSSAVERLQNIFNDHSSEILKLQLKRNNTSLFSTTTNNNNDNGNNDSSSPTATLSSLALALATDAAASFSPIAVTATNLYHFLFDEDLREAVLFNESTENLSFRKSQQMCIGLRPRCPGELHAVDVARESSGTSYYNSTQPRLGGFSSTDSMLSLVNSAQHQRIFTDESLKEILPDELYDMWATAKALWLSLVDRDWKKALKRDKGQTKFTWTNTGDMNKAFFDLCDVASEVMLAMLQSETATADQKNRFWAAFAYHLFTACQQVNTMPKTAMTMLKLNVKLKDYNFGGTRYFKDQTKEEQARRLERKKAIAEARRRTNRSGVKKKSKNKKKSKKDKKKSKKNKSSGRRRKRRDTDDDDDDDSFVTSSDDDDSSSWTSSSDNDDSSSSSTSTDDDSSSSSDDEKRQTWLDNDTFDYQTEDNVKHQYGAAAAKANGGSSKEEALPTPEVNAQRFKFAFGKGTKVEDDDDHEDERNKNQKKRQQQQQQQNNSSSDGAALQQGEKKEQLNILLVVGNEKNTAADSGRRAAAADINHLATLLGGVVQDHFKTVQAQLRQFQQQQPAAPTAAGLKEKKQPNPRRRAAQQQRQQQQQQQDAAQQQEEDANANNNNKAISAQDVCATLRRSALTLRETLRLLLIPRLASQLGLFKSRVEYEAFVAHALRPGARDAAVLYESTPWDDEEEEDAAAAADDENDNNNRDDDDDDDDDASTSSSSSTSDSSSSSSDSDSDSDDDSDDSDYTSSSSDDDTHPRRRRVAQKKKAAATKNSRGKNKTNNNKRQQKQQKQLSAAQRAQRKEEVVKARIQYLLDRFLEMKVSAEHLVGKLHQQQQQEFTTTTSSSFMSTDAAQHHDSSSSSSATAAVSRVEKKVFALGNDFKVSVSVQSLSSIEKEMAQQQSHEQRSDSTSSTSSSRSFDVIIVDAVVDPKKITSSNDNTAQDVAGSGDAAVPAADASSGNNAPTQKYFEDLTNYLKTSKGRSHSQSQHQQDSTSTTPLLWLAPLLERDIFHFMLNENVRKACADGGLPMLGSVLQRLLHPRSIDHNNSDNKNMAATAAAMLQQVEKEVHGGQQQHHQDAAAAGGTSVTTAATVMMISALQRRTAEESATATVLCAPMAKSEFDIALSDTQRRLYFL